MARSFNNLQRRHSDPDVAKSASQSSREEIIKALKNGTSSPSSTSSEPTLDSTTRRELDELEPLASNSLLAINTTNLKSDSTALDEGYHTPKKEKSLDNASSQSTPNSNTSTPVKTHSISPSYRPASNSPDAELRREQLLKELKKTPIDEVEAIYTKHALAIKEMEEAYELKKSIILSKVLASLKNNDWPPEWDTKDINQEVVTKRVLDHILQESNLFVSFAEFAESDEKSSGHTSSIHYKFGVPKVFKRVGELAENYNYKSDKLVCLKEDKIPEKVPNWQNKREHGKGRVRPLNMSHGIAHVIVCCGYHDSIAGMELHNVLKSYHDAGVSKVRLILGQYNNPTKSPAENAEIYPVAQKQWVADNSHHYDSFEPGFIETTAIGDLYNTYDFMKARICFMDVLNTDPSAQATAEHDVRMYVTHMLNDRNKQHKAQKKNATPQQTQQSSNSNSNSSSNSTAPRSLEMFFKVVSPFVQMNFSDDPQKAGAFVISAAAAAGILNIFNPKEDQLPAEQVNDHIEEHIKERVRNPATQKNASIELQSNDGVNTRINVSENKSSVSRAGTPSTLHTVSVGLTVEGNPSKVPSPQSSSDPSPRNSLYAPSGSTVFAKSGSEAERRKSIANSDQHNMYQLHTNAH